MDNPDDLTALSKLDKVVLSNLTQAIVEDEPKNSQAEESSK